MRIFWPTAESREQFDRVTLEKELESMHKFGALGVSDNAIYVSSFFRDRKYYIPFSAIERIYKRVAMSKGGFSGKGAFISIAYIVVVFDGGKEIAGKTKREEDVDRLISYVKETRPEVKTLSQKGEKILEKLRKEEEKRYKKSFTLSEENELKELLSEKDYIEKKVTLSSEMALLAKKKRSLNLSKKSLRYVATAITLLGVASLLFGLRMLLTHSGGNAIYFTIFGLAAIFLFSGLSVLPTGRNNAKSVEKALEHVEGEMKKYVEEYPGFKVPYYYAHPVVFERMIRIIREGRASTIEDAFSVLKDDLKKATSDVKVTQEEYDEITAIKPMFLLRNYA